MKKILIGILVLALAYTVLVTAIELDKSTLITTGSNGNCEQVSATFCNNGTAMAGTTNYTVLYTTGGDPKSGSSVYNGTIEPLAAKACTTLTYDIIDEMFGTYMFKVFQRPGHPGTGILYSAGITVTGESCTNEIPEFTTIGAGIVLLGAGAYLLKKRK